MNAYGQTTDPNSGFLRELGGRGSTGSLRITDVELGWQQPEQALIEFVPHVIATPFQPKSKDTNPPAKRFVTSPRPKTSCELRNVG